MTVPPQLVTPGSEKHSGGRQYGRPTRAREKDRVGISQRLFQQSRPVSTSADSGSAFRLSAGVGELRSADEPQDARLHFTLRCYRMTSLQDVLMHCSGGGKTQPKMGIPAWVRNNAG